MIYQIDGLNASGGLKNQFTFHLRDFSKLSALPQESGKHQDVGSGVSDGSPNHSMAASREKNNFTGNLLALAQ